MTTEANRRLPRQARSQATVDAILEAAAQLLIADGFDKMSTNAVAKRAGVSVGSVYQYFSNKEGLCAALLKRFLAAALDVLVVDDSMARERSIEAVARHLIARLIRVHRVRPELHRVLMALAPQIGMIDAQTAVTAEAMARVQLWLQLHQDELRPGLEPALAAWMITHTVEAIVIQICRSPVDGLNEARIVDETTRLVVGWLEA